MNNEELKLVADHLGHNIDIHTNVYKMQSSVLEETKVAKLLIAMENGGVAKWKGKNLSDMTLEGNYIVFDISMILCTMPGN